MTAPSPPRTPRYVASGHITDMHCWGSLGHGIALYPTVASPNFDGVSLYKLSGSTITNIQNIVTPTPVGAFNRKDDIFLFTDFNNFICRVVYNSGLGSLIAGSYDSGITYNLMISGDYQETIIETPTNVSGYDPTGNVQLWTHTKGVNGGTLDSPSAGRYFWFNFTSNTIELRNSAGTVLSSIAFAPTVDYTIKFLGTGLHKMAYVRSVATGFAMRQLDATGDTLSWTAAELTVPMSTTGAASQIEADAYFGQIAVALESPGTDSVFGLINADTGKSTISAPLSNFTSRWIAAVDYDNTITKVLVSHIEAYDDKWYAASTDIPPLRLIQRDDHLGKRPNPRLKTVSTRNSPTSLQGGVKRVGSRNTWW